MEPNLEINPFISIISDYGFKVTFGNERNTLFLRKSLQALIGSESPIVSVTFDKTAFDGITRDGRSGLYDMACTDDKGNSFIVEMQWSYFEHIIQRLKFYGFQKFNTLVRKGDFDYADLPKIYCIGILAQHDGGLNGYHHIGMMKNHYGELMDEQMQIITVELKKFHLQAEECITDLEKLIFTMKSLASEQEKPIEYPKFWTEEWLRIALHELDTRAMSPEKRMAYEMTLANNAEAIRKEKIMIDEAKAEGKAEAEEEGLRRRIEAIKRLIGLGMDDQTIADAMGEPLELVAKIRSETAS